jgi:DNA-directed RNA polymerase subunit RPC12/RpoP
LGVCSHCGAVVLKGWHRQTPEGLLCQRCAGQE